MEVDESGTGGEEEGPLSDDELKERMRFEVELEFVQSLANPRYLNHLAQTLQLEDESVLAYLEYLKYWSKPEYAKYVLYPHCLYFLDLLTRSEEFRQALKDPHKAEMIHMQQFYHWQYLHASKESPSEPESN